MTRSVIRRAPSLLAISRSSRSTPARNCESNSSGCERRRSDWSRSSRFHASASKGCSALGITSTCGSSREKLGGRSGSSGR